MSSPEKKRKKEKKLSLLSLPDDLLLRCIARVSRLYYTTLSLVSKHLRSLIASPELYKVRSLLGITESCLYVCLSFHGDSNWFTLCRKPKSRGYVLARIPVPHSPSADSKSLVAVGSNIYNFVGSSNVNFLDCQSHTWRKAPCMPDKLEELYASVVDQKIYVAGRLEHGVWYDVKNLVVVFDTKTQVWDPVPIPCNEIQGEIQGDIILGSTCIDGKFQIHTNTEVVSYNSKESKWDRARPVMSVFPDFVSYCEIGNVLFSVHLGVFRWYDTEKRIWREVGGLRRLPGCFYGVEMGDHGGKMAVFWERRLLLTSGAHKTKIWYAKIALKKCSREIRGKLEWIGHVFTLYGIETVVKVLAATV